MDSLLRIKKVDYVVGGDDFTYAFILPDGSIARTRCTPTMSNGFLYSFKIEFGHSGNYHYDDNSGTYKESFYHFELMNKVENVFQQYVNKYGTPETKKGRFTGFSQSIPK